MTIRGTVLPNGRTQFFSNAGAVLAAGSVGFYIPASLTAKATYQDDALTIANVNPVLLDAAGSALIWGSGEYRMIVKDSLANVIFDGITYASPAGGTGAGFGQQTNLASAATCDLGTISTHNVLVTGATTISSFGSAADVAAPLYLVTFQNIIQVTYNAASLLLPTAANYSFAAGDAALCEYLGTGNWQVLFIMPAAQTGSGKEVKGTSPTLITPILNGHATIEGIVPTGATGTGNLVFATSPTLTTPNLGVATAASVKSLSGTTGVIAPATPTNILNPTSGSGATTAWEWLVIAASGGGGIAEARVGDTDGQLYILGQAPAGPVTILFSISGGILRVQHNFGANATINWTAAKVA